MTGQARKWVWVEGARSVSRPIGKLLKLKLENAFASEKPEHAFQVWGYPSPIGKSAIPFQLEQDRPEFTTGWDFDASVLLSRGI